MPNYSNSKIYKIVDNTNGNVYFGSTTQKLSQRLAEHCRHYQQFKNGTRTNPTSSFKILENGNFDIVLLEECNCETKEQLHSIERKYIENNQCVNRYIPLRTKAEYQQDNSERLSEYHKQYYLENQKAHQEKSNEKIVCECGCISTRSNMVRHKKSAKHQELMK